MQLREFRDAVASTLANELGTLPNGMPAVWVDSGDAPGKVKGLLALIDRQPNMREHYAALNYQAVQNLDWVLRLVLYDRSPSGYSALDRAVQKLRQRFPNHRERALPPTDGVYPQVSFLCNFDVLIDTFVV